MPAKKPSIDRPAIARIFLVDDHPFVRKGIADCLRDEPGLAVCGQAGNATEALAGIAREKPDMAVVDISLPGRDGLELIKDLKRLYRSLPVLVLSMHDESLYAERVLRAGGRGYVMKSAPTTELIQAIRKVLAGEIAVSQGIVNELLGRTTVGLRETGASPLEQLTDRELEILRLLAQGLQRREIAEQLSLSVKTVETHRENMRHKLGLRDAVALRQSAVEFFRNEAAVGLKRR